MSDAAELDALEAAVKERLADVCACAFVDQIDREPCRHCGKPTAIVLIDKPDYRATYVRSGSDGCLEIIDDDPDSN